jgi:hypothetical protein
MEFLDSQQRVTQAEPDNTERATYRVGIRYSALVGSTKEDKSTSTKIKHWSLVFTPVLYPVVVRTVEVIPNTDGNVAFTNEEHAGTIPFVTVAEYTGSEEDIERVLEAHPMRGTKYSACFNNCQHFVAAFLLLLQSFVYKKANKSFQIVDRAQMQDVLDVLTSEGMRLYNKPNMVLQFVQMSHLTLSGWAAIGLAQAAEATVTYTVTSTVPASGIAGWFGATTSVASSVVAPAAYAPVAAAAVPFALIATAGTGAAYLWQSNSWKSKSMFNNPKYYGFPKGQLRPLEAVERVRDEDRENKERIMLFGRAIDNILISKGVAGVGPHSQQTNKEPGEGCQCGTCRRRACRCALICVCCDESSSAAVQAGPQ